jgi:hypothetical protein
VIQTINHTAEIDMARSCRPLNELERIMDESPNRKLAGEFPTFHRLTPGLYCRTVVLEAGESCVSKIHRTEHQFCILSGVAVIWSPQAGWEVVQSPYQGVTKVGTRRAVKALCRVVWATYHATDKTDIAEIERELFE